MFTSLPVSLWGRCALLFWDFFADFFAAALAAENRRKSPGVAQPCSCRPTRVNQGKSWPASFCKC